MKERITNFFAGFISIALIVGFMVAFILLVHSCDEVGSIRYSESIEVVATVTDIEYLPPEKRATICLFVPVIFETKEQYNVTLTCGNLSETFYDCSFGNKLQKGSQVKAYVYQGYNSHDQLIVQRIQLNP